MQNKINWQDGVPFSEQFGDVYFSTESGLEESNHVFLDGNNLKQRWQKLTSDFTVIETGFGTGLNFFAAWDLWRKSSPSRKLHYLSIEKYPLSADDIAKSANLWPLLAPYIKEFCAGYPHDFNQNCVLHLSDNITLELLFCDARDALTQITTKADAWFLDGFSPAKNPDMWNDNLYQHMAQLTKSGGTFSTFTCAGAVRRGLQEAGFTVEKVKGFGKKRTMLRGTYI
jgi:tRNA 5-methylaminomethyl-2-thiouridine biosynthesis bifunctional protein